MSSSTSFASGSDAAELGAGATASATLSATASAAASDADREGAECEPQEIGGDRGRSEWEPEEELLLSQRALDFLAELPGTNPATPRSAHTPDLPSSSHASCLPSPTLQPLAAFSSGALETAASSAASSPEVTRPDTTPVGRLSLARTGAAPPATTPPATNRVTVEQKL